MNSSARQITALLLLSFIAYELFPYVPTLDLHAYWRAIKPVVIHPTVHAFDVASYAVIWIVVAALLADLTGRGRSRWLIVAAMIAVISAKILITHNRLSLSELVSLPIVGVAWQLLSRLPRRSVGTPSGSAAGRSDPGRSTAALRLGVHGHELGWAPFFSILHGSMAANTQALANKVFLYSSLIWLITVSGRRHLTAGALVAAGLFVTSMLETHLPGRSAEITDAVIALGAAAVLGWIAAPAAARPHAEHPPGRTGADDTLGTVK